MADHYGTVILPARPLKPRDKAKVKTGVQIAERQILAVLRDQRFFTVGALNQAMIPLLARINERPFQKLPGSRNKCSHRSNQKEMLPKGSRMNLNLFDARVIRTERIRLISRVFMMSPVSCFLATSLSMDC